MSRKKPRFGEGDIIECRGDNEYGSVFRYLVYGYLPETGGYAVLRATDISECGAGMEDVEVEPDEADERYFEKFGKKIGFIDLSIFMDGAD